MRSKGDNSLGMVLEQKSPSEGPAWSNTWWLLPSDVMMEVLASCLPPSAFWRGHPRAAEVGRRALTSSGLRHCQQVEGWASRRRSHRCRVTRQARKKWFGFYLGPLLTTKDSQVTGCHLLCWDNLYINQAPLGVNISWKTSQATESAHCCARY